jgi:hypothetical protein
MSVRRRTVHGLALAAATLVLAGCESTPRTRSDYDPSADFSAYRTFAFVSDMPEQRTEAYESLVIRHLQQAARNEMEARGYGYTTEDPDLLIGFSVTTQDKIRVNTWGGGPYWAGPYRGWGATEVDVRQYTEGTLIIDLIDARKRQVVWQGVAQGTVTEAKIRQMDERIPKAVAAIFEEYRFRAPSG